MNHIRIRKLSSLAHTSLLESGKNIFWIITLSLFISLSTENSVYAKEVFSLGDGKIQILSDKAYRKTEANSYEAHGNVIIKLQDDTIYGEKASISLTEGIAEVLGNVRYVGAQFTLYATQITYDLKNKGVKALNAKLIHPSYTLVGKEITRKADMNFYASDAEYSTCKDCPESWAILGTDVRVIPNQYIIIKHGYLKANGVIIVYIPYISFPIKKDRESGLLFPKISPSNDRGFFFQQPVFWAPAKNYDFTFFPTFYGNRGEGIEIESRYAINNSSSLTVNTLQTFDKIWLPKKITDDESGERKFRQQYEVDFYYKSDFRNTLFIKSDYLSDLDIVGDYERFDREDFIENEKGLELSYQRIFSNFHFGVYSSFKNNTFFENAKGFDHSYVQTMPRIDLSHNQIRLVDDFFFINHISLGQRVVLNYFKQNHIRESSLYRNAIRADYTPFVNINYNVSDFIDFNQEFLFDYQSYRLLDVDPEDDDQARKYGNRITSVFSFDLNKEFGRAYNYLEKNKFVKKKSNPDLIVDVPELIERDKYTKKQSSSYIHNANYQFIHRFYEPQQTSGNSGFIAELNDSSSAKRFDNRDIIRGNNRNLDDEATRTDIAESNSIEIQINNSLFRKSPRLSLNPYQNFKSVTENFDLSRIAYFNVSQGLLLNTNNELRTKDKLTRLLIQGGVSIGDFSFGASEYYFYSVSKHKTSLNFKHTLDRFIYSLEYSYDSFSASRRLLKYDVSFILNDQLSFEGGQSYDLEDKRFYSSNFKTIYTPSNNCWKFAFELRKDDVIRNGQRISDEVKVLELIINYDNKSFDTGPSFEI